MSSYRVPTEAEQTVSGYRVRITKHLHDETPITLAYLPLTARSDEAAKTEAREFAESYGQLRAVPHKHIRYAVLRETVTRALIVIDNGEIIRE